MSDFRGHLEIARAFLEIDEKFESMEKFVPKTAYDMQILSLFSQYMVVFITSVAFLNYHINKHLTPPLLEFRPFYISI